MHAHACTQYELQQVVERYGAELAALEAQCQGYFDRLLELGELDAGGQLVPAEGASTRGRGGGGGSVAPPTCGR